MEKPPANIDHTWCRRRDRLTAQRIDVSLVFLEMLGAADASEYLARCEVPAGISSRVLVDGRGRRRDGDCWLQNG
ncbi:hypothetical protein ACEN9F_09775 [Duganella sp. CT11-25]|jgi:hypothetical protein|uniref:hypothetical protein n=1 Tax=unclassified Duganella TaxID=2636909 RepID=UPI0039B0A6A2